MKNKKVRNILISLFVIVWTVVFHYESVRGYYLEPMLKHRLPKTKFLFPPAGWIMFFNVDDTFGHVEVYGVRNKALDRLDPHEIISTRFIGFDNIHRNILVSTASDHVQKPFCDFLGRKFPGYENFVVTVVRYPSLTDDRYRRVELPAYQCR